MKVLKRKILWSFALKLKLFLILFLIVCFNCKRYLSNWSDQKILLLPPVAFFPSFQYHITAFCINSTRSRSIARGKYHGLFLSFRRSRLHRLYSSVRPDKLDMRKKSFLTLYTDSLTTWNMTKQQEKLCWHNGTISDGWMRISPILFKSKMDNDNLIA